jgi:hypothetical protein
VVLNKRGFSEAVVRDQIPMTDNGLIHYLPSHTSPLQWDKLLNNKVFFWVTRDRLLRLLNAGAYRLKEHDVLEAKARPLFKMSRKKI